MVEDGRWWIKKTDGLGRVDFRFSHKMDYNYSKPFMNSTYVNVFIRPFIGEYDVNSTSRNVKIASWKVISFEEYSMQLQLKCESPLNVSLNFVYDTLVVQIVNRTRIFKTVKGEKMDHYDDKALISKQMIVNELSESMVSTAESSKTFMTALLVNNGLLTSVL